MRREFIKEVVGDLLYLYNEEIVDVIAHGANCFCTMGAGIAKQIKEQFPEAYYADMYYPEKIGDMRRLGNISGAHNNEVYNIYTQYKPGANADLIAVRLGLRKLNALFGKDKDIKTLGLPLIGCGIGGLNWSDVKKVIIEEITDMNLMIVHFTNELLEVIPTTTTEFNDKWRFHIETGFESQGLMIANEEVIKYLNKAFTLIPAEKHFVYSQIKLKFNQARVYVKGLPLNYIQRLEQDINEILNDI